MLPLINEFFGWDRICSSISFTFKLFCRRLIKRKNIFTTFLSRLNLILLFMLFFLLNPCLPWLLNWWFTWLYLWGESLVMTFSPSLKKLLLSFSKRISSTTSFTSCFWRLLRLLALTLILTFQEWGNWSRSNFNSLRESLLSLIIFFSLSLSYPLLLLECERIWSDWVTILSLPLFCSHNLLWWSFRCFTSFCLILFLYLLLRYWSLF